MERRDFCTLAGVCGLVACTGGLAGCARLLDWSGGGTATREIRPGSGESTSAPESGEASATAGAEGTTTPGPASWPDLAVFTGSADPGTNVRAAVAALGGMERFVKRGAKVVVKPNVLTGRPPEFATTTNPDVISAVVRMCFEAGAADVVVLDRPTSEPRTAFDTALLTPAVESAGGRVKFLTDRNFEKVSIPQGRVLTAWPLVTDVFEADTFINVPIAKTHGMAGLTMSMKNLMGIMGGERGTIHQSFDQKIVDVNTLVKPHLVILDAWRTLIRNGPTGGSLKDVRLPRMVVAGTSQVAVDAYGAAIMGWKATDLSYLKRAADQGLGVIDLGALDVLKATT